MSIARLFLALAVIAAMLVAPLSIAPAFAGPMDEAREHYQKGNQLYQSGDYQGAIREFAEADRLAPSPILGFNIALCHDRMGNTDEAIRRYREYLKAVPKADNRAAVEASIQRLEAARVATNGKSTSSDAEAEPGPDPAATEEGGTAEAPQAGAAYTGSDPGLKRVAAIDVAAIRARYRGGAKSEGDDAGQGQSAAAGPVASEDQADVPPPAGPPVNEAPVNGAPAPAKATPIYKKWWFWVVLGVGAIVIVNLAVSDRGLASPR